MVEAQVDSFPQAPFEKTELAAITADADGEEPTLDSQPSFDFEPQRVEPLAERRGLIDVAEMLVLCALVILYEVVILSCFLPSVSLLISAPLLVAKAFVLRGKLQPSFLGRNRYFRLTMGALYAPVLAVALFVGITFKAVTWLAMSLLRSAKSVA
jgi:hypothetical protein